LQSSPKTTLKEGAYHGGVTGVPVLLSVRHPLARTVANDRTKRICLLGDSAMLSENTMQRLALTFLAIGLMSVTAVAQSSTKAHCPRGYDLIGTVCQNSSTGDVVLPE
jgi:hypothetical protein